MTRTFDSGLPQAARTLIRNGIKTKLAPMLRNSGAFASVIGDYPIVMKTGDDHELNMAIDIVGTQCPAYLVGLGDMSGKRTGAAGEYVGDLDVEVYCITNHMRHIVTGRLAADVPALVGTPPADQLDPGVEVMAELARMFLADQYPYATALDTQQNPYGTRVKELRFSAERELLTTREHTIWGVQFTLQVSLPANMLRGATVYLTELLAKHRIGAGATPDPTTPPLIQTLTELP